MLSEGQTSKPPDRQGDATGTQYHRDTNGLIIQELRKSVQGFQTSLEIISAKFDSIGEQDLILVYFAFTSR